MQQLYDGRGKQALQFASDLTWSGLAHQPDEAAVVRGRDDSLVRNL
jgi:hypothetical protein